MIIYLFSSGSCDESSSDQLMQCGYNPNYCIISENVCNKFIDCSDGSDESNATCNKGTNHGLFDLWGIFHKALQLILSPKKPSAIGSKCQAINLQS